MYAILFDVDAEMLKRTYANASWNDACADVRNYLSARGFGWMQGSAYFGDDSVDAVPCARVVQRMARKCPRFTPAVRDIRMLRIEQNNDLKVALLDDDED